MGFLCLNKGAETPPEPWRSKLVRDRIVAECVKLVRDRIGPVGGLQAAVAWSTAKG
jgi:hypothetical protein